VVRLAARRRSPPRNDGGDPGDKDALREEKEGGEGRGGPDARSRGDDADEGTLEGAARGIAGHGEERGMEPWQSRQGEANRGGRTEKRSAADIERAVHEELPKGRGRRAERRTKPHGGGGKGTSLGGSGKQEEEARGATKGGGKGEGKGWGQPSPSWAWQGNQAGVDPGGGRILAARPHRDGRERPALFMCCFTAQRVDKGACGRCGKFPEGANGKGKGGEESKRTGRKKKNKTRGGQKRGKPASGRKGGRKGKSDDPGEGPESEGGENPKDEAKEEEPAGRDGGTGEGGCPGGKEEAGGGDPPMGTRTKQEVHSDDGSTGSGRTVWRRRD